MSTSEDRLRKLLSDSKDIAVKELHALIDNAKADSAGIVQQQGQDMERYLQAFVGGEISKEEFEDLVRGLVSLDTMELGKLSVAAKIRVGRTAKQIGLLVLEQAMKRISQV